jgi:hypothetical protein
MKSPMQRTLLYKKEMTAPLNPMRELMYRLQCGRHRMSYEGIRDTCKGQSHGFVQKPAQNTGRKARPVANSAAKNR